MHTILFKETVVENVNCSSTWTLQRKYVMLSIAHHPEQLTGAEAAASQHWQSPCPTPRSQHSPCSWGTISAQMDAQLPHHPHCQSLQGSFETGLEHQMGFINNLQNFNTLKTFCLTQCSFEMLFDNQRENKEILQFSCILFTGCTIHFIYKWLKITKSKQAEA